MNIRCTKDGSAGSALGRWSLLVMSTVCALIEWERMLTSMYPALVDRLFQCANQNMRICTSNDRILLFRVTLYIV